MGKGRGSTRERGKCGDGGRHCKSEEIGRMKGGKGGKTEKVCSLEEAENGRKTEGKWSKLEEKDRKKVKMRENGGRRKMMYS